MALQGSTCTFAHGREELARILAHNKVRERDEAEQQLGQRLRPRERNANVVDSEGARSSFGRHEDVVDSRKPFSHLPTSHSQEMIDMITKYVAWVNIRPGQRSGRETWWS